VVEELHPCMSPDMSSEEIHKSVRSGHELKGTVTYMDLPMALSVCCAELVKDILSTEDITFVSL